MGEIASKPMKPSDRRVEGEVIEAKLSEEAHGHIMDALINQYKDEIGAVLREYSANGLDSTIAAKSDAPIEVTLPTTENPILSIRDYGLGLDREGLDVYVTFGESTKRDDDSQTGSFGLGCKVGFTLREDFYVVAVKDGVKRFSAVGTSPEGKLALNILKTIDTNEPNGVEVRLSVGAHRVNETIEKAQNLFRFWKKGSVLVDGVYPENWLDSSQSENYISNEYGTVADLPRGWRGSPIRVSMGNIAYDVDMDTFASVSGIKTKRSYGFSLRPSDFGFGSSTEILLSTPVRSLDVTPSRDSLIYSTKTVDKILELLNGLRSEAYFNMAEEIKNLSKFSDAERKIFSMKNLLDIRKKDSVTELLASYADSFKGHNYVPRITGAEDKSIDLEALKHEAERLSDSEDRKAFYEAERNMIDGKNNKYRTVRFAKAQLVINAVNAQIEEKGNVQKHDAFLSIPFETVEDFNRKEIGNRTLIIFDKEDGYDVHSKRFSAYRMKVSEWMKAHGLSQVFLAMGLVDKSNPWIFENDNIKIVSAVDMEADVKAARDKLKAERKAMGLTPSKPRPKSDVKYEFYYPENGAFRTQNMTIKDIAENKGIKTFVYTDKDESENKMLSVKLSINDFHPEFALVRIKGNRSVDVFRKRAEEEGVELISKEDYLDGMKNRVLSDAGVRSYFQGLHNRNLLGNNDLLFRLALAVGEHKSLRRADILGFNLGDIYDTYIKKHSDNISSLHNEDALVSLGKNIFNEECWSMVKDLDLPDKEEFKKTYSMLNVGYRMWSKNDVAAILEYIDLVNSVREK